MEEGVWERFFITLIMPLSVFLCLLMQAILIMRECPSC